MAIGGMSFSLPGVLPTAITPGSPHASLAPNLLWSPLTITNLSASPSPAYIGNATTISVNATGGLPFNVSGNLTYSYSYSGLPTGCTSTNTSNLSCTPSATGTFTVVATVSDAGGNVTKNAVSLQVDPFTITSFSVTPATDPLGSPIDFAADYAGAVGAVTWTWTGLPANCTGTNVKAMSCTPTVPGTYDVNLSGTDTSSATDTVSVLLTVTPVSVSSFSVYPSTIYTGETATFSVVTSGTTGPVTYAYSGLPNASPGCLSANTSSLSCEARVAGSFPVTVNVTDMSGHSSTATATLTVDPLTITSFTSAPNPAFQFIKVTLSVTVAGEEGPVVGGVPTSGYVNLSYSGLPTGCQSANSTSISCSPTEFGTFSVTATASDPTGNVTTRTLSLVVDPAALPNFYVAMNSSVEQLPVNQSICSYTNNSPFYSSTCYPQAQDPSVVAFANGTVGLGYGIYTNATNNTCASASANTKARVAFSLSSDNGTTFYHRVMLGPVSCTYLNAIEPSFAANSAGDVYGVFILENSSSAPNLYGVRSGDSLGFVSSLSGGMTFSAITTLDSSGNLARPAIAVSGSDIYVVYEDIANSSTPIPGGVLPISVKFLASTDGGATWSTPMILPGLNKTSGWNAMSPSIAVSGSGEIAVAYATDRSCVAQASISSVVTCLHYGAEVVVVTSTSNGATWTAPRVASTGILSDPSGGGTGSFLGETTCYAGVCQPFFFQSSPDTSVAFDGTGAKLFVAWAGTINSTATVLHAAWWRWSGVGVSGTTDNGLTWTGGIVAATNHGEATSLTGNVSNYYHPAIGVIGSELYLTYSEDNETSTSSGIGARYPGPFDNSLSQWADNASISSVATSAALAWGSPAPISWTIVPSGRLTNFTGNSFTGYVSSVAASSYGFPLIGYALAHDPVSTLVTRPDYYSQNYTYTTALTVAALAQLGFSQVIGLTIATAGLTTGTTWSVLLDYQLIQSTAPSLLVLNVPKDVTVFQKLLPLEAWGENIVNPYVPSQTTYYSASTLTLTFSILFYFNISVQPFFASPTPTPSCNPTTTYCYSEWEVYYYMYECIPIAGYTCTSAPAQTDPASYTRECGYSYQYGCYWLYAFNFEFAEYGPGGYFDGEFETIEELYGTTPSSGFREFAYIDNYCYNYLHPGCSSGSSHPLCTGSYTLPDIGTSCTVGANVGIWLPDGFTISGSEEYYYTTFGNAPQHPTYYNGTGAGSQTGTNYTSYCFSNYYYSCPTAYYIYYYYAIYDPYECYYYGYQVSQCQGTPPMTIHNPINETLWNLPSVSSSGGTLGYPVDIVPQGLPAGTPYRFTLAGTSYNATSPNSVQLSNVAAGLIDVNGSATGTTPGWEYYAPPETVNVPTDVIVNLTFSSYVDVAAPAQAISIHALNLTTGTAWQAELNGTVYTSSIPWINLTAKPGDYGILAWGVNSSSGDTHYSPINPTSVNFVSQTSYDLSFVPSYRVGTDASRGGTIQLGAGKPGGGTSAFFGTGATVTVTATPAGGYEFLGFTGTGAGSYTGNGTVVGSQNTATLTVNGPIEEVAEFGLLPAARYGITFHSMGLPAGTPWSISLGGVGYSTTSTNLTVNGLYVHNAPGGLGNYNLVVGYAYESAINGTRFIPGGYPSTVWANATGTTTYTIVWSTQYLVTLASTPGGSVKGSAGTLQIGAGSYWEGADSTVAAIAQKSPTYRFLGWNGTGTGSVTSANETIQFKVTGPISEVALFEYIAYHPQPSYTVDFLLVTPVEAGTTWTLTVANATETWQLSSVTDSLNATGLQNGTYTVKTAVAYAPDGVTRYVAISPPTSIIVQGQNSTERLSYSTQYWVSVSSSALGAVTVTQGNSNNAAALSGWYNPRTVLILNATPVGDALFVGWSGNGTVASGAYSGPNPTPSITVNGPVQELAVFQPPVPPVITNGGFFSTMPSWLILAAVGLIVGLGIGILVFRRQGRRPRPVESAPSAELYGSGGMGATGHADREAGAPSVSEAMDNPGADQ